MLVALTLPAYSSYNEGKICIQIACFLLNIQSLGLISGQIGVVFYKIKVTLLYIIFESPVVKEI